MSRNILPGISLHPFHMKCWNYHLERNLNFDPMFYAFFFFLIAFLMSFLGDEFPGIFTLNLPERCWASDNKRLVFSSVWRSQLVSVKIVWKFFENSH